ncbi:hypothetical protein D5085_13090 [Ectothiorhodospiraceae bacterium BW-2]|nr:hypothetical protein D5085_13090 [Ectothiorhodospiraceae bacterium BW-2]
MEPTPLTFWDYVTLAIAAVVILLYIYLRFSRFMRQSRAGVSRCSHGCCAQIGGGCGSGSHRGEVWVDINALKSSSPSGQDCPRNRS